MNTFAKRVLADVVTAAGVFNDWQDEVYTAVGRNLGGRMVNFDDRSIEFDMAKTTIFSPRDLQLITNVATKNNLRVSMYPKRGSKVTLSFFTL